jgi:hypothetical protein
LPLQESSSHLQLALIHRTLGTDVDFPLFRLGLLGSVAFSCYTTWAPLYHKITRSLLNFALCCNTPEQDTGHSGFITITEADISTFSRLDFEILFVLALPEDLPLGSTFWT